jgi:hypothetical protein
MPHNAAAIGRPSLEVTVNHTQCGSPRPAIRVVTPKQWNLHRMRAELYALAMRVELSIPSNRSWNTSTPDDSRNEGYVEIHLMDGDDGEVKAAVALLEQVVREALMPAAAH